MKKVIITVLGQDRPGILAAVSENLAEQNCNIENVSQMVLQLKFVGFFIVSLPTSLPLETFTNILKKKMTSMDLYIHVDQYSSKDKSAFDDNGEPFIIAALGPDNKGLVAGLSKIIAKFGVNITNLRAIFKGGNDPGDNVMVYEISITSDVDQLVFFNNLRKKAKELGLDLSIQHKNIFKEINRI